MGWPTGASGSAATWLSCVAAAVLNWFLGLCCWAIGLCFSEGGAEWGLLTSAGDKQNRIRFIVEAPDARVRLTFLRYDPQRDAQAGVLD